MPSRVEATTRYSVSDPGSTPAPRTARPRGTVHPKLDQLVRTARANLRRRFARQPVAFVISGGGSQGSFEVGVLRFLYDELRVRPSIVCGISVGAIIAAKLAEGDDPATGRRAIDEVEAIWRGLRSNDDLWTAQPWLEKLHAQVSWASSLRSRAGEQGTAGSQARVVLRMLGEVVRHPPEADGTLEALRQAMRAQSLMSSDPVRRMVEEHVDPERVAASGIRLRVGAVSLESGVLRYVTEAGALHSRSDRPLEAAPVPLHDAVLASAAIPVVYPPVRLGEEHYVDGGVREILPVRIALDHLGARHIFAVVASAGGVDPVADFGSKGLLEIARRVSADIGPDETRRKETDPRGWGRRVTLVAPELDVHDALTVDPELIAASIDYGWMRAADLLLGLGPEAEAVSAQIARVRARIRRAQGPVPGFLDAPPPDGEPGADDPAATQALIEREVARLADLIDHRRRDGLPLAPALHDGVPESLLRVPEEAYGPEPAAGEPVGGAAGGPEEPPAVGWARGMPS